MVDRRRIEELQERLAETLHEIEELERQAAEELATPQERRARFRVIRGGKAVILVPLGWLAARARDHQAAAVAAGSAVLAAGAISTGLLVSADGIERPAESEARPVDIPVDSSLPTPADVSPAPASATAPPGSTQAATSNPESTSTAPPDAPSGSALNLDLPVLPPLPPVSAPVEVPPVPTALPSPEVALSEAEALERCLALIPPPVDIDACVRELLDP